MTDTIETAEFFKTPTLQPKSDDLNENVSEKKTEAEAPNPKPKRKSVNPKINVPLPYTEPDWGGNRPPPNYALEIIKNGTLISNVGIRNSFLVFGRLEVCDFVFEHPSVSRYHAVIQYCKGDESHPKGFYLYDLGSTHGTFLNKDPVKPKIYYKLKVGYVLKFGGSSRLHIFQGPEEEEIETTEPKVDKEDVACTWGIGDDASAEDGEGINPFALTANEELYVEDPKKTLRGWFEREGYEVEYNVEEKGFRTFSCTVRLPIDTPTGEFMPVEASVSGKKKEAVIACALEACRTLDRLGLLRQSHHEGRQKKRKKWEENDYYDSDEDTFYDRSGEIEKRREMRKKLAQKAEKAENFESLSTKHKELLGEIEEIERKISACTAKDRDAAKNSEEDSLEMYMSNLAKTASAPTDKFEKRKLKLRLIEAEKEKLHLEKLLDIARPAHLPPVVKVPAFVGKKLKSKFQLPKTNIVKHKIEDAEEVESDTEKTDEKESALPNAESTEDNNSETNEKGKKYGLDLNVKESNDSMETTVTTLKTTETVKEITESNTFTSDVIEPIDSIECPTDEILNEKKFINSSPIVKKPRKAASKKNMKNIDVYETKTADYVTWTPPTNQSGDGITHLNAKYGY